MDLFRSDHGLKDGSNLKIAFFSVAPHRDQATTNNREIKTTNDIMIVKLKLLSLSQGISKGRVIKNSGKFH